LDKQLERFFFPPSQRGFRLANGVELVANLLQTAHAVGSTDGVSVGDAVLSEVSVTLLSEAIGCEGLFFPGQGRAGQEGGCGRVLCQGLLAAATSEKLELTVPV
jgi:hypothetical protein